MARRVTETPFLTSVVYFCCESLILFAVSTAVFAAFGLLIALFHSSQDLRLASVSFFMSESPDLKGLTKLIAFPIGLIFIPAFAKSAPSLMAKVVALTQRIKLRQADASVLTTSSV